MIVELTPGIPRPYLTGYDLQDRTEACYAESDWERVEEVDDDIRSSLLEAFRSARASGLPPTWIYRFRAALLQKGISEGTGRQG